MLPMIVLITEIVLLIIFVGLACAQGSTTKKCPKCGHYVSPKGQVHDKNTGEIQYLYHCDKCDEEFIVK